VLAGDADLVRLAGKPDFRALGARFGKRTPLVARAVTALAAGALRELEAGRPVTVALADGEVEVLPGEVQVLREVVSDWVVQSQGPFVVAIDPALTEDLRAEGLAREVVNRVQRLRKDAGLAYTDRIALAVDGPPALLAAVRDHAEFIRGETLARELATGAWPEGADRREEVHIDGTPVRLAVTRSPGTTG